MKFEKDQDKIICNKKVIARMTDETPRGKHLEYANLMAAAPDLFEALKSAWYFIENVADNDHNKSNKFFKLREQVRNAFWIAYGRKGDIINVKF